MKRKFVRRCNSLAVVLGAAKGALKAVADFLKESVVIAFFAFSSIWLVCSLVLHEIHLLGYGAVAMSSTAAAPSEVGQRPQRQSTAGSFVGAVVDYRGMPVHAAEIWVVERSRSAVIWRGRSDETGGYSSPMLPSSEYDLAFWASGYQGLVFYRLIPVREKSIHIDAALFPLDSRLDVRRR